MNLLKQCAARFEQWITRPLGPVVVIASWLLGFATPWFLVERVGGILATVVGCTLFAIFFTALVVGTFLRWKVVLIARTNGRSWDDIEEMFSRRKSTDPKNANTGYDGGD